MTIEAINLSLSNRCNAKCIWCPTSRGTKNNFDMSFEIVAKLISEIKTKAEYHDIKMIHLSENGEALYNNDFLKITRYIKQELPNVALNLLSNFGLMTPELSKILLEEKLLSSVQVNIDGHDSESYKAVKGISYNGVIKNVKAFLEARNQYDPTFDFTINVMPAFEYVVTVNSFFQSLPDRFTGSVPYSSYEDTVSSLRSFVPEDVRISHSKSGLWAERNLLIQNKSTLMVDQSTLLCPLISRVETEAFIAPNGDWYACCLDDNNDIVFGNILNSSLGEIYYSTQRNEFLKKLKEQKFEEIGYPCNTVACCQSITINKEQYEDYTKNFKTGTIMKFKT